MVLFCFRLQCKSGPGYNLFTVLFPSSMNSFRGLLSGTRKVVVEVVVDRLSAILARYVLAIEFIAL